MSFEKERHTGWLELFYDLVFAAAIAQLGQNLSYDITLYGFTRYIILFVLVCWAWTGATFYSTRFNVDDLIHRILILLQMAGAVSLAVNISDALDKNSIGFALSYIAIRIFLILEYVRTGSKFITTRSISGKYSVGFSFTTIIWILSLFVPTSFRFIVWIFALLVDIVITTIITRKHLDLTPNTFHLSERFGLFVIIVLGETVFGLVVSLTSNEWSFMTIIMMGGGLTVAFGIWWVYFDTADGSAIRALKERGQVGIYLSWLYLHFPLLIGIAAMGDGISHIVKAEQDVPLIDSEVWLVCLSVALCLFSVGLLHLITFLSNSSRGVGLKWLFYRFISGCIIIMIPILGFHMLPIILLFTISLICIIQVVIDLKYHPHHREFKLF